MGIKTFLNYFDSSTMYRSMVYYLLIILGAAVVLSALHFLPYSPWDLVGSAIYLSIACYVANKFLAKVFHTKTNLESPFISALILSLITGPLPLVANWGFFTIVGLSAMASKYLLAIKKRHLFNPAALGVLFGALALGHGASWWVGDRLLWPVVAAGGVIMIRKMRNLHLVASFLATYLGLVLVLNLLRGGSVTAALLSAGNLAIFSPLLFFSLVMLVEPLTGPPDRKLRIAYGIVIGALLTIYQNFLTVPYTLELALLSGNIFARLVRFDPKLVLRLVKKEITGQNIVGFWFAPVGIVDFTAGQFLEWTLPHGNPDSRGVRRYFTIASSPTEPQILLATKFAPKSSSFKTALRTLQTDDEITAANLEGSFTLPKDEKRKLLFIAGGIGITPFRSMVKYMLDQNQCRGFTLLYSINTAEEIVFQEIFEQARQRCGAKIVYTIVDPKNAPPEWQGNLGFIDAPMIEKEVPDFQERLTYISGPEPMVKAFVKLLGGMGVKKANLKRDFFPGYTETYQNA